MKMWSRFLLPAAAAVMMLCVPGGSRAQSPDLRTDKMFLEAGDLVTASGKGDVLIRLRPKPNGKRYRVAKVPMGQRLVPKAVTSNKFCEKIAIANAHNIVVFDVWTREITSIDSELFGEIADVQYDWECNLIVADMGMNAVGRSPRDGRLWMVSPSGEIKRIGWRHQWSNPAFLDMDQWGTLYVVDKGAGPRIPGSGQWHYDAIYKLGPPKYVSAVRKFNKRGLDVSSFVLHPSGKFYIGNQDELLVLENDQLSSPCGGPAFIRVNGLAIDPDLGLFLLDGFDVFGASTVYRVDDACNLKVVDSSRSILGSQGLTAGLPGR